jgi:hypothetical protein
VSSEENSDTKRHFSFVVCTESASARMRGGTSHYESGELPIFLDNCLFSRVIRFMFCGRREAL